MVKNLLLYLLFISSLLIGEEIKIEAHVNPDQIEDRPIEGTITVSHNKDVPIDPGLFLHNKKPLSVSLIKEVQITPNNPYTLSIYKFSLPPQKKGAYLLSSISLSINGKTYKTLPSSYEVILPSAAKPLAGTSSSEPFLKLEIQIDSEEPIHPGQRFKVIYRYLYQGDIKLTEEQLPLLKTKKFLQIGEEQIKKYEIQGTSVLEVSQEYQADKPGKFHFPVSLIQGITYDSNRKPTQLTSQVKGMTITIAPLPEQEIPASFTGAIGNFSMDVNRLTPEETTLGNVVSLSIKITGPEEQMDQLSLPNIFCQPGFAGLFRQNQAITVSQINPTTKEFLLDLRPISPFITSIPSVYFSYYDPNKKGYTTLKSKSFPLHVQPPVGEIPKTEIKTSPPQNWEKILTSPPSLPKLYTPSNNSNRLHPSTLYYLLVLGLAVLGLQYFWQKRLLKRKLNKWLAHANTSFYKCLHERKDKKIAARAAYETICYTLYGQGKIKSLDATPEAAKQTKLSLETAQFLSDLFEVQYGNKEILTVAEIQKQLKKAMELLRRGS